MPTRAPPCSRAPHIPPIPSPWSLPHCALPSSPEGPDRCAALHRAHFIPPSMIPIHREPLDPSHLETPGGRQAPSGRGQMQSDSVQTETTPWEFTGQLRGPRAGGAGGSLRQPPCPGAPATTPFFRCLQRTAFATHGLLGQRLCLRISSGEERDACVPVAHLSNRDGGVAHRRLGSGGHSRPFLCKSHM